MTTCKIGLIWRHMKTLVICRETSFLFICSDNSMTIPLKHCKQSYVESQLSIMSIILGHMSQTGPKKCFIPQNCEKYTTFYDWTDHSLLCVHLTPIKLYIVGKLIFHGCHICEYKRKNTGCVKII